MTKDMHSQLLGIDVGKRELHIATLPQFHETAQDIPVTRLDLSDPGWWRELIAMIAPGATITAESTGYHLLAPVAAVISRYCPDASLWQVDGKTTGRVRDLYVSSAKTDILDATALLLIAGYCAAGNPPRGVKPYEHAHADLIMRLRLLVNQHVRLSRDYVRQQLRRSVLAYSINPLFAESETYYTALSLDAVTPGELRALAKTDAYADGRRRHHLVKLVRDLPDIEPNPTVVAELRHVALQISTLEQELETVEAAITAIIDAPPFAEVTRRWRILPNGDDVTLASLHVAVHGETLSMTIDEFKASVGANPITNTSGQRKKTKMSRKGFKPARTKLHFWTMTLLNPKNCPNPVYDYYHGREKRNIFAARNKLARVLWGVAKDVSLDLPAVVPPIIDDQAVPAAAGTDEVKKSTRTKREKRG